MVKEWFEDPVSKALIEYINMQDEHFKILMASPIAKITPTTTCDYLALKVAHAQGVRYAYSEFLTLDTLTNTLVTEEGYTHANTNRM